MLNPKYTAPAVAPPLQIDALLAVPALYAFASERAVLDVLAAHRNQQDERQRRVDELSSEEQRQRQRQLQQQSRSTSRPRPSPPQPQQSHRAEWKVFLVNTDDAHGHLHAITLGADARVGSIYAQLPAPFNDSREWLAQVRCDGRALLEMDQTVARAGIADGAVLQLTATRRVDTAACEACGAVMSFRELAAHDCIALKQSGDGIPCEKCGALIPPELYMAHVARCK